MKTSTQLRFEQEDLVWLERLDPAHQHQLDLRLIFSCSFTAGNLQVVLIAARKG